MEPYRQRELVRKLEASSAQVFLTTHSTSVLAAAGKSSFWYVHAKGAVGSLDAKKIEAFRRSQPEMFLCRFAIVAEGVTEAGFITLLLERALGAPLEQFGILVADAGGNDLALRLLLVLSEGGLAFGGFADDEGTSPDLWKGLGSKLDKLLFRWDSGCLEDNVFKGVPSDKVSKLFEDEEGASGVRLRTVADRLGTVDKDLATLTQAAGGKLLTVMIEAATGYVPEDKKKDKEERKKLKNHAQSWFKSLRGGRELAEKMLALGAWPSLSGQIMPFLNAVRGIAGLPPISDLPA